MCLYVFCCLYPYYLLIIFADNDYKVVSRISARYTRIENSAKL